MAMSSKMKNVPSYLKGLAETRARVSADLARYLKLQQEIEDEYVKAMAVCESYGRARAKVDTRISESNAELAACDRLIRKFDGRLKPDDIEPIQAWRGRYGKRGARNEAILRILKERFPEPVTTFEVAWLVQIEFKLDFESGKSRAQWQHNSIGKELRDFLKRGVVESLHNPSADHREAGLWRLKVDNPASLEGLLTMAEDAGLGVQEAPDPVLDTNPTILDANLT
jgi:hypothetical protein